MKIDKQLLNKMIQENYVKVQKHPEHDLFIYNYTAAAQYDRIWNECTIICRGLILDEQDKVIARPFPKFFNLDEREDQNFPSEPFEVYEKMDGSLGLLYWIGDVPHIATRGSFSSEQALKATQLLHNRYKDSIGYLNKDFTYLFEIIYPENRIVVDYGKEEKLVLLAVIDKASGEDQKLTDIGFPVVPRYDGVKDIRQLKQNEEFNKEGYVIKFKNGYRVKVKFEEYQRIHFIVTMVSSISIWEYLKEGKPFNDILDKVPDEFFQWVKETKERLTDQYDEILRQAKSDYKVLASRKDTALYFQTCQYPSVMFNILNGKSVEETIWKMIRPKFEKPFVTQKEEN